MDAIEPSTPSIGGLVPHGGHYGCSATRLKSSAAADVGTTTTCFRGS